MAIQEKLRRFIIEGLRWDGPVEELDEDYPLLEKRVLDSLGIYKLVTFIENEYDIEVDDSELVPEHFGTMGRIQKLIEGKAG